MNSFIYFEEGDPEGPEGVQGAKGLPLRANDEVIGTADVVLHKNGGYAISNIHITDPDFVRRILEIDYSQFSIKEG